MPLDSRIAMSYRMPQIEGPLDQYRNLAQLQQMMQQNQMGRLQMEEAARRQAEQQAFQADMQSLGPNPSQEQLSAVASRHVRNPEKLMDVHQRSLDRKSALEQRLFEQQQALQARKEAAEQALAAKIELAKQAGADRRTLMEMQLQGRREIAGIMAANRQPQAPVSIEDPRNPGKAILVPPAQAYGQRPFQKPSISEQNAERKKQQTVRELDAAIVELERASADGGLIDKSTGSGAGAIRDAVGNFVGYATEGAQAVGALQPIYDMALKMVPRFEGPQSDKDTKSYQEASGQLANPKIPNATKKVAAREIVRLMKARRGQFVAKDAVGTEADVPAGAQPDPLGIR